MAKSLEKWVEEADAYMLKHYCINVSKDSGAGIEEFQRAMADGDTPKEFCEWWARKFDLETNDSMRANWGRYDTK